jgi:hypothetical protein
MESRQAVNVMLQVLFGCAMMAIGPGELLAQQTCPGSKPGECVEFTLRYYQTVQKGSYSKIEVVNPKTLKELSACKICDPTVDKDCGKNRCDKLDGSTLLDATPVLLLQTYKNPMCYYICSGGWCRWICVP